MTRSVHRVGVLAVCASLALAGCDEGDVEAPPEPVRAIKYMTLTAGAPAQVRRISGVVEAGTSADVAFQTAGQVVELTKNVGDQVAAGELLARLDPEPLRLRVTSARSELQQASAALADARSKHAQQKQLFDKGYATRTNFESALATMRTAQGAVGVAQSQLRIAERDLKKSELIAPFAGVIAKRAIDKFEEAASGQTIYVIQTEDEFEISVSLPETLITSVGLGDSVQVSVPQASTEPLAGVISEIAPLAEGANAYPVTVKLAQAPSTLRPGMSAQALFEFETAQAAGAYSIPITALKPDVGEEGGTVFVFGDGTLSARKVRVVNVRDNNLQVEGDVKPGEVIATAGVSLLYDGMPARLLDPAQFR